MFYLTRPALGSKVSPPMKTSNITSLVVLSIILTALVLACDPVGEQPQAQNEPARASAQAEKAGKAPATHEPEADDHEEHEHGAGRPEANDSPLLGQATAGEPVSDSVELVSAADIIANPDQFAGRTVRLTGQVKGYCQHRRAWFALDVPEATPPYLRVLTAPAFLVPPGVMDAQVTAVGVVEVEETPQARMRHIEREHELGSAGDQGSPGRAKRVVIRATGAEFQTTQP